MHSPRAGAARRALERVGKSFDYEPKTDADWKRWQEANVRFAAEMYHDVCGMSRAKARVLAKAIHGGGRWLASAETCV